MNTRHMDTIPAICMKVISQTWDMFLLNRQVKEVRYFGCLLSHIQYTYPTRFDRVSDLGPRPEQSGQNIARTPSFTVETRNYKHQGITKRTIFLRIFVKAAMNIDFISSMKVEELKDFLKLRGLKVSWPQS